MPGVDRRRDGLEEPHRSVLAALGEERLDVVVAPPARRAGALGRVALFAALAASRRLRRRPADGAVPRVDEARPARDAPLRALLLCREVRCAGEPQEAIDVLRALVAAEVLEEGLVAVLDGRERLRAVELDRLGEAPQRLDAVAAVDDRRGLRVVGLSAASARAFASSGVSSSSGSMST